MAKGKIDIKKKGTALDSETEHKLNFLTKSTEITTFVFLVVLVAAIFSLGAIWNDHLAMKQATYQNLSDEVQRQNYLLERLIEEHKDHPEQ